jgi:hypothetical protein
MTAAPKLTPPKQAQGIPPFDPSALGNMDPQFMMQMSQALQRLPKGQMQRLQAIMQKAMAGKDVTQEAAEFERTLPPDFIEMMKGFTFPGMPGGEVMPAAGTEESDQQSFLPFPDAGFPATPAAPAEEPAAMTEEQARALVAQAAAEGRISKEQAEALLQGQSTSSTPNAAAAGELKPGEAGDAPTAPGKFWRNLSGKKS